MPKLGSNADSRIFFSQLESLDAARLRATGAIRLEGRHDVVNFGDTKAHRRRPYCFQERRPVEVFRQAGID
jgi:hypothetical protein